MISIKEIIKEDSLLYIDTIGDFYTVLNYLFDNNLFPYNSFKINEYFYERTTMFSFTKGCNTFYVPTNIYKSGDYEGYRQYHFNDIIEFQKPVLNFDIL